MKAQVVFSSVLIVKGSRKSGQIRDLLGRIPGETVLETRKIKESVTSCSNRERRGKRE